MESPPRAATLRRWVTAPVALLVLVAGLLQIAEPFAPVGLSRSNQGSKGGAREARIDLETPPRTETLSRAKKEKGVDA